MGKYVQWTTYKGKDILFLNAAGTNAQDGIAAWEEMRQEVLKGRALHLVLIDATDATMDKGPIEKAKKVVEAAKRMPGTRIAFVGMNPLLRPTAQLMATRLRLDAHFCATADEAREWLVKEDIGRR